MGEKLKPAFFLTKHFSFPAHRGAKRGILCKKYGVRMSFFPMFFKKIRKPPFGGGERRTKCFFEKQIICFSPSKSTFKKSTFFRLIRSTSKFAVLLGKWVRHDYKMLSYGDKASKNTSFRHSQTCKMLSDTKKLVRELIEQPLIEVFMCVCRICQKVNMV